MAYEFKLPDLGEGLTEGEVARWLVAEGDEIAEDEPLVEIQTDKTTVEIPSPAAGTVLADPRRRGRGRAGRHRARRDRQRGRRGRLGHRREARPPDVAPAAAAGRVQATPLVRRIAEELGVDLATVTATGPGGRHHRGRRARALATPDRRSPREGARRPPPDRRAPDPRAPRDAGRHVRRGVRLHRASTCSCCCRPFCTRPRSRCASSPS